MTASGAAPVGVSVAMPAYEEAANLELLLPRLIDTLTAMGVTWEILVVDTAEPRDATPEICERYGVRHVPRRGGDDYGDAIRTGIADSTGERVVIMDTDGSHGPEFIPTLWASRDAADVIIASRYVKGGSTDNPWLLVAFSRVLNAAFSVFVRLPARDVSNSFRLYRGDQVRAISLTSKHFDVQEEILGRLLWELDPPATVAEVPFQFKQRAEGTSKRSLFVFIGAFLAAMFRLRALRRSLERGSRP